MITFIKKIKIMDYKEKILELDKLRYDLLDKGDVSLETKIDDYGKQIIELLKTHFDTLEFEFIIFQLSRLGDAPNLLYDDNGMWCVTSDGMQTVISESPAEEFESCFVIKDKKVWADNPREALRIYLFNYY